MRNNGDRRSEKRERVTEDPQLDLQRINQYFSDKRMGQPLEVKEMPSGIASVNHGQNALTWG